MTSLVGRRFRTDTVGATAVEYALISALIAVSCIVAWQAMGNNVASTMTTANAQLDSGVAVTQQGAKMGGN